MTHYLNAKYDLNDPDVISILDEVSLWSAPFGLRILELVPLHKCMRVLDIGCGLGFPLIELAMRMGESCRVYGIDPWKAGIERVRQKIRMYGLSNVEANEGHAEQLPFESGFFDLVVSNNGLNNVQDIEQVLKECNRVLKVGAKLIFTFNTDRTFIEFYDVYRQVLNENGLERYSEKLSGHIYAKRKPIQEIELLLQASAFKVTAIDHDIFHYRFADGTSMLNHFVMKLAFLEPWKSVVPEDVQSKCFGQIEHKLNAHAVERGGLSLQVPFTCMSCEKLD